MKLHLRLGYYVLLLTLAAFLIGAAGAQTIEQRLQANRAAGAELVWPDRRPMGRIFLSHSNTGWKTNPRAYLTDQNIDVLSEAGIAEFGEKLMAYADRCVDILKKNNAQGVIVWDIEGQEMPHPFSYIGDPRVLPQIAPEMHRFADAFFARFTDADIPVGITIRPTRAYHAPGEYWVWQHRKVSDPVAEMADKIAYAKKRWGVSIVYIDSNVGEQVKGNIPWILPVEMMRDLAARHPDVLMIPEWDAPAYYRYMAPYKDWWDGFSTPREVRQRLLQAFSFIVPKPAEISRHWDGIVAAVAGGDVLWLDAWYPSRANTLVRQIYRAAGFHNAGVSAQLQQAGPDVLLAHIDSPDPKTRYQALRLLGERHAPGQLQIIVRQLASEDWLMRHAAIEALGRSGDERAVPPLIGQLKIQDGHLQFFAVQGLAELGTLAVPALVAIVDQRQQEKLAYAIDALGWIGSKDATGSLVALLQDGTAGRGLIAPTLGALQKIADPASVAAITQYVNSENQGIVKSAFEALGNIGNAKALEILDRFTDDKDPFVKQQANHARNIAHQKNKARKK